MHKVSCFITLLLFVQSIAFAQWSVELKEKNADCNHSIDITGQTAIVATAPMGSGAQIEIQSKKGDLMYFETEHNLVWYRFRTFENAELSFIISPQISSDDYDFILFECENEDCCSQICSGDIQPVRSNISRNNVENKGQTGLGIQGTSDYVHEGKGNNFSNNIKVKSGFTYYLVLDNVYGGEGGHRIDFTYIPLAKKKNKPSSPMLNLFVTDQDSGQFINSEITLLKFDKDFNADTIRFHDVTSIYNAVEPNTYYQAIVTKEEYLSEKISFSVKEEDSILSFKIELQSIKVGKTFELKKVFFQGGTANFAGNSQQALRALYRILKENENLKIEIQGHVNLPNGSYFKKTEEYYNQLSIDRAKAVYDYLVKRGIEAHRMEYQGFGYSKMINPNANTSAQMQQNRRVEIKVLDN